MADDNTTSVIAGPLWRNEYDSLMRLQAEIDGSLQGIYSSVHRERAGLLPGATAGSNLRGVYRSHTGASGEYRVRGCVAAAADETKGRGIALSISWRPIGSRSDNGRHWVSGMGGQLLQTQQGPRLLLLHNLVVSTASDRGPTPGFHIDKLHFDVSGDGALEITTAATDRAEPDASSPLSGTWVSSIAGDLRLQLSIDVHGDIDGNFVGHDGATGRLVGLTDNEAPTADLPRQAVTIATAAAARATSLSGWLDRERDELVLLELNSAGTSYAERWLQTRAEGLRFNRV